MHLLGTITTYNYILTDQCMDLSGVQHGTAVYQ